MKDGKQTSEFSALKGGGVLAGLAGLAAALMENGAIGEAGLTWEWVAVIIAALFAYSANAIAYGFDRRKVKEAEAVKEAQVEIEKTKANATTGRPKAPTSRYE